MMNFEDPANKSRAMVAISTACLSPFLTGNPLATMYESLMVSTYKFVRGAFLARHQSVTQQKDQKFLTLHLVNVVAIDPGVKHLVQGIEERHHLRRMSIMKNVNNDLMVVSTGATR